MLQSWIREFKQSLSVTITGYLLQAVAAITLLIAVGFATAAIVISLKSMMSEIYAYLVVAAGYTLIGLVIMAIGRSVEESDRANDTEDSAEAAAVAQTSMMASVGTVAGLVMAHPGMALTALRVVLRNIPAIVAGLLLGGLLFSDSRARAAGSSAPAPSPEPQG